MGTNKTEGKHHKRRVRRRSSTKHQPLKTIRIPAGLDQALVRVCPEYLRGFRCAEQRVRWALEVFLAGDSLGRVTQRLPIAKRLGVTSTQEPQR